MTEGLKNDMTTHTERRRHLRRHLHDHGLGLRAIFGRDRGGAVRRGIVRNAILALLRDEPMHGYQIIQELERKTGGRWRPSAGSIYPTLQLLEDEGLIRGDEVDGRRTYSLTDAGRKADEMNPLGRDPWFDADAGTEAMDLRKLAMGIIGAAVQVKRHGSAEANARAREILVDARRRLYGLLAEDDGELDA
ncbi:MAG TPA: PadR family transcriptional regulator [candidate division Zixibacteria bacterium]|nr:PadR family transcriptional regulator [candidate division Zixibacteria bacterium]